MKIGLVLEHFDPRRGGLEGWTWHYAFRLAAQGHEVHVVACDFASADPRLPSIVPHPVTAKNSPWPRALAFARCLRQLDLDIVHDMGCGWLADVFHPHGGSTRAFQEHNLMRIPVWRRFRLWREQRYREQARIEARRHRLPHSLVAAVSKMVWLHFEKFHGLNPSRLRLIYNGVDTGHFSPDAVRPLREAKRRELGLSENDLVYLMVAHNLKLKNAAVLLEAFARLPVSGTGPQLLIAGGRKVRPFEQQAGSLGVADRVRFHPAVEDVRSLYAAADVMVHPTWYDPCSLVTLEALACGLPVITTCFNGAAELMADGREGFVLSDPADSTELANRMRLLFDREQQAKASVAARSLAQQHGLEQQDGLFLQLYQEILSRRSYA